MSVESNSTAKSQPDTTSALRLVIRAEIIPEEVPRTTAWQRLNRRALVLVFGAVAVLVLSWVGFRVLRTDSTPALAVSDRPRDGESQFPPRSPEQSEAAPVVNDEPPPRPATPAAEMESAAAKPVESEVRQEPEASPSPTHEVIPDVPRSARETIRGTVRVSVRVIVDPKGTVLAATPDDPGPSRYFERLALEASKKWTFAPAEGQEQRLILVQFNFTRAGTTARANPLQ